jgi:hypothetical protein
VVKGVVAAGEQDDGIAVVTGCGEGFGVGCENGFRLVGEAPVAAIWSGALTLKPSERKATAAVTLRPVRVASRPSWAATSASARAPVRMARTPPPSGPPATV